MTRSFTAIAFYSFTAIAFYSLIAVMLAMASSPVTARFVPKIQDAIVAAKPRGK